MSHIHNKKISILMPAYNAEMYIADSIQSVVDQTYSDWELLIVDDGSTDKTLHIAQEYAKADKRIQVFHQANKGGCAARNLALTYAKGDFIQYLDADDMLDKDKIRLQLEQITDSNTVIYGTCVRLCRDGQMLPSAMHKLYKTYESAIDAQIAIWENHFNSFQYSSYLIPYEIVQRVGQWNESLKRSQDSEYMARVLAQADRLLYVADSKFYYRQVENSVSSRPLSKAQIESEAAVCDIVSDLILTKCRSNRAIRACNIHYTDVLTAWYPQNKFIVKQMLFSMKQKCLQMNFENRGKTFRLLEKIFSWRVAVIVVKFLKR